MQLTEEKRLSRREFIKVGLAGLTGLSVVCLPGYSFFVEKNQIEIKHVQLSSIYLPSSFQKTKIVHISDIHFGFFYDLDQLQKLVMKIQSLKPDIICLTGDLIDHDFSEIDAINVSNCLKELNAPYGKFAVFGNHDYGENTELVRECLTNAGFRLLVNEVTVVNSGDDFIYVSGIDDMLNGKPDLANIFNKPLNPNQFHMLLVHEPDVAKEIMKHPVDLQLSGHSHGGQVNLPFLGPVITPPLSKQYPSGLYKINHRLTLNTNRGIGTTILPFRFLCRPEITVIELYKG